MKRVIYLFCLVGSSIVLANETVHDAIVAADSQQRWDDTVKSETLLDKDREEIQKLQGSVQLLLSLEDSLTRKNYHKYMQDCCRRLSTWLDHNVTSYAEMVWILNYFDSEQVRAPAAKVNSALTLTNILFVLAVVVITIAAAAVLGLYIAPCLKSIPKEPQILGAYLLVLAFIYGAYMLPTFVNGYLGCLGAFGLAGAYSFHISLYQVSDISVSILLIPVLVAWSCLALFFNSELIGFITITLFVYVIGFSVWTRSLCIALGFRRHDEIARVLVPSAILILIYLMKANNCLTIPNSYLVPFEDGVLFMGPFVYFITLVILSSRYYSPGNYCFNNMVMVYSILLVLLLGFGTSTLSNYRVVSCTCLVVYLMQKYADIPWNIYWSFGLLGGGALLFGVGMCLQAYWRFLFPETSHNF